MIPFARLPGTHIEASCQLFETTDVFLHFHTTCLAVMPEGIEAAAGRYHDPIHLQIWLRVSINAPQVFVEVLCIGTFNHPPKSMQYESKYGLYIWPANMQIRQDCTTCAGGQTLTVLSALVLVAGVMLV
eukprot:350657-Chlamydomonas_euryale.AAC.4